MIWYVRPMLPWGFPDAAILRAATTVRAALGVGCDFPPEWGRFKDRFAEAQFRKCGFCESKTVDSDGEVEHYFPKAVVEILLAAGRERPHSSRVTGRRFDQVHAPGYWWLAYDWDNWLLACLVCNRKWKKGLFPVEEDPHPAPDELRLPTPLLLNPFAAEDPLDHLDFDEAGMVAPFHGSPRGRATIVTCGLDRASLVTERGWVGMTAKTLCDRVNAATTLAQRAEPLSDLCSLGAADRPYAGTVRTIARREFRGISWDLVQTWSARAAVAASQRPM